MRDIDILVRPESVSEVIDILEEKGFKPPKNTFKHFNKVRKSNNKYNQKIGSEELMNFNISTEELNKDDNKKINYQYNLK